MPRAEGVLGARLAQMARDAAAAAGHRPRLTLRIQKEMHDLSTIAMTARERRAGVRGEFLDLTRLLALGRSLASDLVPVQRAAVALVETPPPEATRAARPRAQRRLPRGGRRRAPRRAISPSSEWLLDNFHLVANELRSVRHDLPPRLLPPAADRRLAAVCRHRAGRGDGRPSSSPTATVASTPNGCADSCSPSRR